MPLSVKIAIAAIRNGLVAISDVIGIKLITLKLWSSDLSMIYVFVVIVTMNPIRIKINTMLLDGTKFIVPVFEISWASFHGVLIAVLFWTTMIGVGGFVVFCCLCVSFGSVETFWVGQGLVKIIEVATWFSCLIFFYGSKDICDDVKFGLEVFDWVTVGIFLEELLKNLID